MHWLLRNLLWDAVGTTRRGLWRRLWAARAANGTTGRLDAGVRLDRLVAINDLGQGEFQSPWSEPRHHGAHDVRNQIADTYAGVAMLIADDTAQAVATVVVAILHKKKAQIRAKAFSGNGARNQRGRRRKSRHSHLSITLHR